MKFLFPDAVYKTLGRPHVVVTRQGRDEIVIADTREGGVLAVIGWYYDEWFFIEPTEGDPADLAIVGG